MLPPVASGLASHRMARYPTLGQFQASPKFRCPFRNPASSRRVQPVVAVVQAVADSSAEVALPPTDAVHKYIEAQLGTAVQALFVAARPDPMAQRPEAGTAVPIVTGQKPAA